MADPFLIGFIVVSGVILVSYLAVETVYWWVGRRRDD